ncbi:hypothetical protein LCGC14_1498810 [marine sediment metagenome]|uniref:Uncharacterized protein n=1 Tax=marine sediment metagenome TaxID=412755 RepID=A0A0F9M641_9ZZZZ
MNNKQKVATTLVAAVLSNPGVVSLLRGEDFKVPTGASGHDAQRISSARAAAIPARRRALVEFAGELAEEIMSNKKLQE